MAPMIKKCKGFTLIELAIVVAVIGIIIGMIYVSGGSLFNSSRTAKTISIINDLSEATLQFKGTYKALPGDMLVTGELSDVIASCRTGGGNAGNENGVIDATESVCVVEHLFRAGLIKSDGVDAAGRKILISPYGGSVSVMHPSASNAGAWPRNATVVTQISDLPCDVVLEIDRKIDDDDLEDGRSRAINSGGDSYTCVAGSTVPFLVVSL